MKRHFRVRDYQLIKSHYLTDDFFASHDLMELILKIYTLMKCLETNYKFGGYILLKIDLLKKFYHNEPHVRPLLTLEELDDLKGHCKPLHVPEECTIFLFIFEICRSVEIVNSNGDLVQAHFPLLPKTFY